jgi:hypothetical protein
MEGLLNNVVRGDTSNGNRKRKATPETADFTISGGALSIAGE